MSYQTRISTKKSFFIPTRKFSPPPVLQPKAEEKPDAKLPEWKPGGGGAVSPLQRLIDSPAMQQKQINSPESEAQPEAEIQRDKVNEDQKLLSSPMVQRMEAGESDEFDDSNERTDESGDSDHGSEYAHAPTEDLELDDLDQDEFNTLDGSEQILKEIFQNLCDKYQINLDKSKGWQIFYEEWSKGVVTRGWWQKFKEWADSETERNSMIIMPKRKGNTDSYQQKYTTSNFGYFEQVTYRRDGQGNINFDKTKSYHVWQNPVKPGSYVQLNKGMNQKNKQYGIMGGGQKVKLAKASRSQHFAIGDKLCPWAKKNRKGKWTWHHLSTEYDMVLVDMRVHQKHGHNGGVLLWK